MAADRSTHVAELNKIGDQFRQRDAQYISNLTELKDKNTAYVRQLQTQYASDLNKRDQAQDTLNAQYRNDLD